MNKLYIAMGSFVECLAYMMVALLVMICAHYTAGIYGWFPPFMMCIVVCLLMTFLNYSGKVYGYGFDADEKYAYWIPRPDIGDCTYECSHCGKIYDAYCDDDRAFCARCGAMMEENGEEENAEDL